MTVPIGYPEQFGALLPREPREPRAASAGELGQRPLVPQLETGTNTQPRDAVHELTFADHLNQFVSGIDQRQKSAEHKAEEFAVGHQNDIHGTMIAGEQAEISLHLLANVRNRVVDFYREVMRMGS